MDPEDERPLGKEDPELVSDNEAAAGDAEDSDYLLLENGKKRKNPASSSTSTTYSYSGATSGLTKAVGFNGLRNLGGTCYMNSLLQAMFMTPEFRTGLYQWEHDPEKDEPPQDCIPYQLQALFGQLQLGKSAVSTKPLTISFGWNSEDCFRQNDAQELCRVLFDALERTTKGTPQAQLIEDNYQGKMLDYIRCHVCKKERTRDDSFMDLSLVIQQYTDSGSTFCIKSVHEALEKFLEAEVMKDGNKIHCENCEKKCDATKGLRLAKLPQIMTLHLKRFAFDFQTMRRKKLNDRVCFPFVLDFNPYVTPLVAQEEEEEATVAPRETPTTTSELVQSVVEETLQAVVDPDATPAPLSVASPSRKLAQYKLGSEEYCKATATMDAATLARETGKEVFELYGVLVHSGGALGGHYYAFIKDMDKGKWYKFNDSTVSDATVEDVMGTWGKEPEKPKTTSSIWGGSYMYSYTSSATAYLLLYRRAALTGRVPLPTEDAIPKHVEAIVEEAKKHVSDFSSGYAGDDEFKLTVYCPQSVAKNPDSENPSKPQKKDIVVSRKRTFKEFSEDVYKLFGLEKFERSNIRVREYYPYSSKLWTTFGGRGDSSLVDLHIYNYRDFIVEVKKDGELFSEFDAKKQVMVKFKFLAESGDEFRAETVTLDKAFKKKETLDLLEERKLIASAEKTCLLKLEKSYTRISGDARIFKWKEGISVDSAIYVLEVEEEEELSKEVKEDSPIVQAFLGQECAMKVKFSNLDETDCENVVVIDSRKTLEDLKKKIADHLKLGEGEDFKLLNAMTKKVLKEFKKSVKDCSIYDNTKLLVQSGSPLSDDMVMLTLELAIMRNVAPGVRLLTEANATEDAEKEDAEEKKEEVEDDVTAVAESGEKIGGEPEIVLETCEVDESLVEKCTPLLLSKSHDLDFVSLGEMAVCVTWTLAQFQQKVLDRFLEKLDALREAKAAEGLEKLEKEMFTSPAQVRLMNKTTRLFEVVRNVKKKTVYYYGANTPKEEETPEGTEFPLSDILQTHRLRDGATFAVQMLPAPEILCAESVVLRAVVFDPLDYSFSPEFEVVVKESDATESIGETLSKLTGIPQKHLLLARSGYTVDNPLDMMKVMHWHGTTGEKGPCDRSPLYARDNELFILKHAQHPDAPLKKQDSVMLHKHYSKPTYTYSYSSYSYASSYTYKPRKEKGIVIKSKRERLEEKKAEEEKEEEEDGVEEAKSAPEAELPGSEVRGPEGVED